MLAGKDWKDFQSCLHCFSGVIQNNRIEQLYLMQDFFKLGTVHVWNSDHVRCTEHDTLADTIKNNKSAEMTQQIPMFLQVSAYRLRPASTPRGVTSHLSGRLSTVSRKLV
jgi:hypothetical protein